MKWISSIYVRIAAAMLIVLLAGCTGLWKGGSRPSPANPDPSSGQHAQHGDQQEDSVQKRIGSMTLDEKIGQMIIAGVDGTEMSEDTKRLIAAERIGGLILYKPNLESPEQTVRLLNQLKEANTGNRIPLLLSIDQEGGKVSRLPAEIATIPSSRDVARTGSSERALRIGQALGAELRAFGFNVNYAPVLDVDSNPANPVIGARSFGSDASIVSEYGIPVMKGIQSEQIIPVVKHFPGHGDTTVDSHLELPVVNRTLEQLRRQELKPFADAIRSGADAVMVAHLLLPELDPDNPASMSASIVQGLLRKELAFDGVVLTDDLTMGAITKHFDLGKAAIRSVRAGVDIVMVAHGHKEAAQVLQALKQAAISGELPMDAIDRSVARILRLKDRYKLNDDLMGHVDVKELNETIQDALGNR